MKFCQHCGSEINENAVVCVKCGCSVSNMPAVDNTNSVGMVVLSVLWPLFGIIYYFVKKNDRPYCAKNCLKGALISWGVSIGLTVLLYAVGIGSMMAYM